MKITANEYQINNSDIAPDVTTVNLGSKNALFGVGHNLSALATHNIVAGEGHIVTDTEDASHQAIFGFANEIKDNYGGLVAGFENVISSTGGTLGNYILGANNEVLTGGGWNLIFGRGAQISSDGNIILLTGSNPQIGQDNSIVIGSGDTMKATTEAGSIIIGYGISQGERTVCLGFQNYATLGSQYGVAMGHMAETNLYCQIAQASGFFAQSGDAQTSVMVARKRTTNDTQTELALDGATKYIITEDNRSYALNVHLIARNEANQDSASWFFKHMVSRGSGFATCLDTVADDSISAIDAGLTGVDFVIDVDTASDGHIKLLVTGLAATNIKWVARVEMTEVKV